jgi:hypothetical protein
LGFTGEPEFFLSYISDELVAPKVSLLFAIYYFGPIYAICVEAFVLELSNCWLSEAAMRSFVMMCDT